MSDGIDVEIYDGCKLGYVLGITLGYDVTSIVGIDDGLDDGNNECSIDGKVDGLSLEDDDGIEVYSNVGIMAY